MPIEFRCTNCDKLLRTPDDTAGREAQCPACGTVITVPGASEAEMPSPEPEQPGGESPFGGENPFDSAPLDRHGDEINPYEAPADYDGWQSHSSTPPADRVRIPAICLMVGSGLGILVQFVSAIFQVFGLLGVWDGAGNMQGPENFFVMVAFQIAFSVLGIVLRAIVLLGAIKMKNLQNYGLAMAAAIIAVIPCFSACCLLELPFGIWALVVLSSPEVKQAFR